jgi:hypothetical protein
MAIRPPVSFEGKFAHPRTGHTYPYAGTAVVAIDSQGRESMHMRGAIRSDGGGQFPLLVLGHVDRERSFVGRELEVVDDFVAQQCERDTVLGALEP